MKPSVQFDRSTLDSRKVDVETVANEQKEKFEPVEAAVVAVPLVPKIDIAGLKKTISDEINKNSAKLWYDQSLY